jgi:hypothetical protein
VCLSPVVCSRIVWAHRVWITEVSIEGKSGHKHCTEGLFRGHWVVIFGPVRHRSLPEWGGRCPIGRSERPQSCKSEHRGCADERRWIDAGETGMGQQSMSEKLTRWQEHVCEVFLLSTRWFCVLLFALVSRSIHKPCIDWLMDAFLRLVARACGLVGIKTMQRACSRVAGAHVGNLHQVLDEISRSRSQSFRQNSPDLFLPAGCGSDRSVLWTQSGLCTWMKPDAGVASFVWTLASEPAVSLIAFIKRGYRSIARDFAGLRTAPLSRMRSTCVPSAPIQLESIRPHISAARRQQGGRSGGLSFQRWCSRQCLSEEGYRAAR